MRLSTTTFVCRSDVDRAKDMRQTRLIAALLQYLLDTVFFAKILLANKLDRHAVGLSQRFGVLPKVIAQGFCKLGIIKDANPVLIEILRHTLSVTEGLQTTGDHNRS